MDEENPYESPPHRDRPAGPMTVLRSVVIVFTLTAAGGLLGAIVGGALGAFLPSYYRGVFAGGNDPGFDPLAVGIGLGLTQGMVFGGVIGLIMVAISYWFHARPQNRRDADA